jgi:hypothetical protein
MFMTSSLKVQKHRGTTHHLFEPMLKLLIKIVYRLAAHGIGNPKTYFLQQKMGLVE